MFKWLKPDPVKSLQKTHDKKFEQAFQAQRNGKIELYGRLTKECDEIQKKIDQIRLEKDTN
jgi:hypothetical protein